MKKLICAFRWSVLPSIMKMHGPKNKINKRCLEYTVWNIFKSLILMGQRDVR